MHFFVMTKNTLNTKEILKIYIVINITKIYIHITKISDIQNVHVYISMTMTIDDMYLTVLYQYH